MTLRQLLQPIVTNGGGRPQSFFKISWLDEIPIQRCMVPQDSGQAIGRELHPYRQGVALGLRDLALESIDSGRDTLEILHMMSDFVRNHVDLAKSPGGKTPRHLIEEGEVEINPMVSRTVARIHGRGHGSAA